MAAYIDLNPVRAGIVEDPKDYRFCGYAEAVAHSTSLGQAGARKGLLLIWADKIGRSAKAPYQKALKSHRELIFVINL